MIRRILPLLLFAQTAFVQTAPAAEPAGPGVAGVLPAASKASLEDNRARPYLFLLDAQGRPSHLFAACAREDEFKGSSPKPNPNPPPIPAASLPFNVCIPLSPAR